MAFASPALDFDFGRLSPVTGVVRDLTAWAQSAGAKFARRVRPLLTQFNSPVAPTTAAPRAAQPNQRPMTERPMTLADQWSKISGVLVRSVDGARIANEMQSAATQQLDLAQYGLLTLVDELSAVMTIPGRRSRSATVHAFNSAADSIDLLSGGRALAA